MFDSLSTRLQTVFDRLGGRGRLTEENIQEALREVRVALLEADVNFKVVREFIERVRVRAIGQDVLTSLTPAQQVVKVVHGELVELLGGSGHRLSPAAHPPTIVMLIGLQGSGKTTTAAKLARLYAKQGQHPILAAADIYRPAAQDQLRTLGEQLNVPVVGGPKQKPLEICRQARAEAAERGLTPLLLDTAGRLHIDETMLDELRAIRAELKPHHVLLVVDAMTGQDAVTVAERFNAAVGIDAVVLTKMDGDSRGGAALSVRHVTGRPIAFVGMGEKTDALEPFHPDRVASRILGMGDVLSLVEKAQEAVDQILGMLPFGKMLKRAPKELDAEQADIGRFDAIISSMTPDERRRPEVINGSRRQRIARGSGTSVQDVNRLLKQYAQLRKMMKQFKGLEGKLPRMKLPGLPNLRG